MGVRPSVLGPAATKPRSKLANPEPAPLAGFLFLEILLMIVKFAVSNGAAT